MWYQFCGSSYHKEGTWKTNETDKIKTTHINHKYTIQIEPLHFEWYQFIPTLEKGFQDIVNEMLSHNSQQQPLTPKEYISIPHRNWKPCNNIRRGINNRTWTLTNHVKQWHTQIWKKDFIISCTAHMKPLTPNMEIIILQTTLIKQLKPEDKHITLHHSKWQTHHMNSKDFMIEDHPGQMTHCMHFSMSVL